MKVSLIFLGCMFTVLMGHAQKADRQVFWRELQNKYDSDSDRVVRVYLDKFGYFYPSPSVPIDKKLFLFPAARVNSRTINSGNLFAYFRKNLKDQAALMRYYNVQSSGNYEQDYKAVEEQELRKIDRQVHRLIQKSQAKNIIFLIHGFNVTDPVSRYAYFEQAVKTKNYESKLKPVYVEVFWDGLSSKGGDLLKVWEHAQNNTRWISLALRDLMRHLSDRLPVTIVTHSLGASVATGALFNTSSKWRNDANTPQVDSIAAAIPAPVDVPVNLGMIVPAIPGGLTFVDFNKRSPGITAPVNNIRSIAIGYNPKDYATSKAFLSSKFGATTLGCNYDNELRRVTMALQGLGYEAGQISRMVHPIQFTTPVIALGLQDHDFQKYMEDDIDFSLFLDKLFN
jgi:hypothetical protein